MKLNEVKYFGNPKASIAFLQAAKDQEEEFLEDSEDDERNLIYIYDEIIDMVKANKVKTSNDLEKIGMMVYDGTSKEGMMHGGDTDLADHIQTELSRLLGINL